MGYTTDVMQEAFSLFVKGFSLEDISNYFGGKPTRQAISNWKSKYDWDIKKAKIVTLSEQRLSENLTDVKERQMKQAKAVQGKFFSNLKENDKISSRDALDWARQELLLYGEATENVKVDILDSFNKDYEKFKAARSK